MAKLIATRGLPGSGKTTNARAWVAADPAHRARVNRDDLRAQLHDGVHLDDGSTEKQVIAVRDAQISALLKRGVDVVCDDTNLPQRTARDLRKLATLAKAEFEVWDLTDVPIETCIARDAARERRVGEQVIRNMHRRYLAGKRYPLPLPEEAAVAAGIRPMTDLQVPTGPSMVADALDALAVETERRAARDWDLARITYDDAVIWPWIDQLRERSPLLEPLADLLLELRGSRDANVFTARRALEVLADADLLLPGVDAALRPIVAVYAGTEDGR